MPKAAGWRADFGSVTVVNSYFPNSQGDHARLHFKLEFCAVAEKRLEALRKKGREVFICGDFNIAHKEIDLKNPKTNIKNAGFLPEERAWMTRFLRTWNGSIAFVNLKRVPNNTLGGVIAQAFAKETSDGVWIIFLSIKRLQIG